MAKIEYFVAPDIQCDLGDLKYLLKWAPRLKHLHIGTVDLHTLNQEYQSIPQSQLRTLILICTDFSVSLDVLAPYFAAMPLLDHLDMTVNRRLLHANDWELLLTTSLPLLKYFVLRTTEAHLNGAGIEHDRASFQNTFWISKTNFRLIITTNSDSDLNRSKICFSDRYRHTFRRSPFPYLIMPDRSLGGDTTTTIDESVRTLFSEHMGTLPYHYYFNNVKYLQLSKLESSTLNSILNCVNWSCILELALEAASEYLNELAALLILTRNKTSLFTDLQILRTYKEIFKDEENCLKCLDLSGAEHTFQEKDIRTIAKLFPRLEHLLINTADLQNIPLLNLISIVRNSIHSSCKSVRISSLNAKMIG